MAGARELIPDMVTKTAPDASPARVSHAKTRVSTGPARQEVGKEGWAICRVTIAPAGPCRYLCTSQIA